MLHANGKSVSFIEQIALKLRIDVIRATTTAGSGHPTSCLSAADLIATLFFNYLRYDVTNPYNPDNDRFILSKGHAIPIVYAAWKQLGVITDEQLLSLRDFNSPLEGHPTPRFSYNEAATGSLGQGLAVGVGMALAARYNKRTYRTYVMLGDGELAEGSVWEGAELAAHYKLNNLTGIIDGNRLGQSGASINNHDVEKYAKKFEAFGWQAIVINGHEISDIMTAIDCAQTTNNRPTMIVAKTLKGYGLDAIENSDGWHGKPFNQKEAASAIEKLVSRFTKKEWILSQMHSDDQATQAQHQPLSTSVNNTQKKTLTIDLTTDPHHMLFELDKKISTRKAYGYALAALGRVSNDVVALDADVKNSTFSEFFAHEFPDRFFQCFIAEQAMVSIATGLHLRGKIPFASTFGAFFARAYDQIRMAGIGRNALRLCGSHCGVSIGQDGPSQMALEDIAMIAAIPNSVILYPSDGISAYKLTEVAANYNDGISYLRTTRADTAVLYSHDTTFTAGGCKILRQSAHDKVCIIAAGITVHESLKAYEQLKMKGICVAVIDAYSIKPLDSTTIALVAAACGNNIITVEDHYIQGGLGQIVASALINHHMSITMLAVNKVSRSGGSGLLLKDAQIDSANIVSMVEQKYAKK
jgi:transketolase